MYNIYGCKKGLETIKLSNIKKFLSQKGKLWVDCTNPSSSDLEVLSKIVKLHPVTLEDIQNEGTRIKYEEFPDYTFVSFMGVKSVKKDEVENYSVYFIIGKGFLITVHKDDIGTFERLKKNKKKLNFVLNKGVDYLSHALIDMEVDLYFPIVEDLYNEIDRMDDLISKDRSNANFDRLFDKKRAVLKLNMIVTPTAGVLSRLVKPSRNFIRNELIVYFRDVMDHLVRVYETLKSSNEQISTTISEHSAISSNKMNDVIKVLTIISTIMLPLTLVTGIYGMNLEYIPGGDSRLSFLIVLAIMAFISLIMLAYFKKKKWI